MNITFTHFGTRVNLTKTEGRGEILETISISDAVALRNRLDMVIDLARKAEEAERESHRERFSLELGIDTPDAGRVCALEVGPFDTSEDAVSFAMLARGANAVVLEGSNENVEWYDISAEDSDSDAPIVGATLNIFSNVEGTVRDVTLY